MIPAAFEYVRADSVDAAIAALTEHGDDAKLLAGGMSLIPLMKLRLATPTVVVDVGRLRDLSYVRDAGDHVAIGALTRHRDLEISDVLAQHCPSLQGVAGEVGDNQVRHRGTLGGSVAHGDPASDLPAVLLALDATLVAQGPNGERTIAVDCDVLSADGGTRVASITGAWVALGLAIHKLVAKGDLRDAAALRPPVAAVSVGIVGGEVVLDLPYVEDSKADVDMNVVMTEDGKLVEVQGTAEHGTFDRGQLNAMLDLAGAGIRQLAAAQRAAVEAAKR